MIAFISSLILAIIILIPLGFKWEIKGKISILGALTIGLITAALIRAILGIYGNLSLLQLIPLEIFIISLLAGLAILSRFYRDPERVPPNERRVILSPADGKLLYVKKIEAGKVPYSQKKGKRFKLHDLTKSDILNEGSYLIGIGMNFLNVHVNRSPISGKINILKHIKGNFFSLKKEESLLQNERVLMVIKNDEFAVGIVQIASRLVRRITSYLREGESVKIGQRVGMIKFGSQVDVVLPNMEGLEISVNVGEELKAGVSIIAKY
ncbi:MAG: phosphatidylserine decarboxylase [bacterium]